MLKFRRLNSFQTTKVTNQIIPSMYSTHLSIHIYSLVEKWINILFFQLLKFDEHY